MSGGIRIGVDVGGTFTDLVLADTHAGTLFTGKLLTTPDDPSRAIIDGVTRILREAGAEPGRVDTIVHGTTLVTNTIIQRTGATIGLVTTEGFRDALEMGKEIRYDLYDLFIQPPPTLVPRRARLTVPGRMSATGEELHAFDADAFRACVRTLRDEHHIEALAVSFIHAYANNAHERAAAAILEAQFPDLPFTLSCEVAPEIREFERTSTACANAYVQPLMRGYLERLRNELEALGLQASLYVMLSGGGIATLDHARQFPITLIESGPAAGAMAACYYGALIGEPDLISFDMGGTTAKMCLIEDGTPERTHDFEAGRVRRFKKGSGLPLKVSVVDMIEIGAGGGSMARVDNMGLLKVGPRSAGSVPGPVAYGLGGSTPCVTDSDLLLGYLDPAYFLGGELPLDSDAVGTAVDTEVAQTLGMTRADTALGIHEVVNENMAAATRRYLAEKGKDPRRYAMIAFGGAGPVHAYDLARLLKVSRLIVPLGAGVTSALGFLVAPPAIDDVRSYVGRPENLDWERVNALYADMETQARSKLVEAGADVNEIRFTRTAEMRHIGQGFEIPVPVPLDHLDSHSIATLTASFFDTYERMFERRVTEVGVEALTWRLGASVPAPSMSLKFAGEHLKAGPVDRGRRLATFPGHGEVSASVYNRYGLTEGMIIEGPAIIEERESTTIAGPGSTIRVDPHLNLIIDLPIGPAAT
jgi:N-methylhydantoinase A